ncbi:uncharacterized protein TM35_000064920 [Trypanosoma theileri]|uniref:Uncharacterized protein n=1 Tax=Trypanosoma theileri TaxID=67003 RepID=A0A1X0P3J2_9TRYP|nr:uncharacterized protein TM35_000064920 [Trypanosoma theileri]ORC91487.1 hypothetical protein TM35_000064920 [Trypanosoma theileri]
MFFLRKQPLPLVLLVPLIIFIQLLLPEAVFSYTVAAESPTLQKVTLVARNGARGLINLTDTSLTCDGCTLSTAGKQMSVQLGQFLLSRYTNPLDLGDRFNATLVGFHATGTERTIITSEAITMGMYPNAFPLVKYKPESHDELLGFTKSWPSWLLRDVWKEKLHADDAWAINMIGERNITTLSQFLPPNHGGMCMESPSLCALYVYDSYCVNASEDVKDPTLQPLLGALESVSKRFAWRLYGVNPGNEVDENIGPLAGPLIRDIMKEFVSTTSMIKFTVNVAPMSVVFATLCNLGVFNATNSLEESSIHMPGFADAIAFEYSTTATQQYIKAYLFKYSSDNGDVKEGATGNNYTANLLSISCTDKQGNIYFSDTNPDGCSVEDVLRYIESQGGLEGKCYVTDSALTSADCDSEDAPAADSLCYFYRSECPGAQCGPIGGAIADPSRGLACQDAQLNKNTPYLTATIVAIGAPCLLAGSMAGFYLSSRIRRLFSFLRKSTHE